MSDSEHSEKEESGREEEEEEEEEEEKDGNSGEKSGEKSGDEEKEEEEDESGGNGGWGDDSEEEGSEGEGGGGGGKKKDAVPWYMLEELEKQKIEEEKKKREEEERLEKIRQEEAAYNAMTPEEREKHDIAKALKKRKAAWLEIEEKKKQEEELKKRKEVEQAKIRERVKAQPKESSLMLRKCVSCGLTVYANEEINVGKDYFHKLGCFKCFYCNMPLKLWNYKALEGRYYCKPHHDQFKEKILNSKFQVLNQEAYHRTLERERQEEEERKRKEEEERRLHEESAAGLAEKERKQKEYEEKRRVELEREAEEMRKFLEAAEMGIPYTPPVPAAEPQKEEKKEEKEEKKEEGEKEGEKEKGEKGELKRQNTKKKKKEKKKKETPEQKAAAAAVQQLESGNFDGAIQELEKIGNINATTADGDSILHVAAQQGNPEIVRKLLEKGADPLLVSNGKSPIHNLCVNLSDNSEVDKDKEKAKREEEVMAMLLHKMIEKDPNAVNSTDADLNTPLVLASAKGRVDAVRALIKAGAKVTPRNNLGATCLHAAADSGLTEVAKQLINVQQMDINMQDEQGYTPLHLAVMGGHADMVRLLVALGADTHIKDKFHCRSPFDEALVKPEMKALFEMFAKKSDKAIERNDSSRLKPGAQADPHHKDEQQKTPPVPEKKKGGFSNFLSFGRKQKS